MKIQYQLQTQIKKQKTDNMTKPSNYCCLMNGITLSTKFCSIIIYIKVRDHGQCIVYFQPSYIWHIQLKCSVDIINS